MFKLSNILLVIAERRKNNSVEEFCYNEAYLLTNPQTRNFLRAFRKSIIGIDLRMHLKENDAVRNRGTGFRMKEFNLISLYDNCKKLL